MNTDIMPISKLLVDLSRGVLSTQRMERLRKIVNQLFYDLHLGHSCTTLKDLGMSLDDVQELFDDTGLLGTYSSMANNLVPAVPFILLPNAQLIYINRYLMYELSIVKVIASLESFQSLTHNVHFINTYNSCVQQFTDMSHKYNLPNVEQLQAIQNSITHKLSFIIGGPGTGKTTIVVLLMWMFYELYGADVKIKICAPTGKAAARVKESIQNNLSFFADKAIMQNIDVLKKMSSDKNIFNTLHKLLGVKQHQIHFKYNAQNTLDTDILIIDESSMIGLSLYSKLLAAINSQQIKHIIFLGDKNQLSSVEEGYVFASLITSGIGCKYGYKISELSISNRNSADIGQLSQAILQSDLSKFNQIIKSSPVIQLLDPPTLDKIYANYLNDDLLKWLLSMNNIEHNIDHDYIQQMFIKFNQQSILCSMNQGLLGSIHINTEFEKYIKKQLHTIDTWYSGRPIIILENDYALGLNNGDIGICIRSGNKILVAFDDGRTFVPETLPSYQLAYAISIHKSQGSEYDHVNIVLTQSNDVEHNICSRELLYTAITRARKSITLFSNQELIDQTIKNLTQRNTGLNYLFGIE